MGTKVDDELRTLLRYYGEQPEAGADSMKPEDFFGMVMSFSSALQVWDIELKSHRALTITTESGA